MDRSLARALLLAGLTIGLIAELLLDGPAIGLNMPIAIGILLAVGWLLRRRGRAPDPLDAWLPAGAMLLAAFVAIRADPFVVALDLIVVITLVGASFAAFSGLAVTRRGAAVVAAMGIWVIGDTLTGPARLLAVARPQSTAVSPAVSARALALGKGLLLGMPLALIFAVLFASADPIFRGGVEELLGLQIDVGELPGRVLFVVGAAWLTAGLLAVGALGIPAMEGSSLGAMLRGAAVQSGRILGTTEALVVLLVVDAVVAAFVGLQVAYLFGGQDTMAAARMSYSTYARRGYFELVAAACLAAGILVVLELNVTRRTRLYVALALGLIAMTAVVLASAAYRLQLYQDAYGWTELRVYVAVSIVALGAGLLALGALLAVDRMRWIGHAAAFIAVAGLIALNLLAPAALVAEQNVARIVHPELVPPDGRAGLDIDYLSVLPDDAIPAMTTALGVLPPDDAAALRNILRIRRDELAFHPSFKSIVSWNLGRERARAALDALP